MLEAIRDHCLQLPGATERSPFGPDVVVYFVGPRMFALLGIGSMPPWLNLKADPEEAIILREQYPAIAPGYHMNKRHWITITLDGSIPFSMIAPLIERSYQLVVAKLPRSLRQRLTRPLQQ